MPPQLSTADNASLEHDPEKWTPVFRKDHAPTKNLSGALAEEARHVFRFASLFGSGICSSVACDLLRIRADADAEDAPDAKKDIQSCLAETGDFVTVGKSNHYVIGIENKCPQRLQCVIDAYITGAKGPVSVHTSMTLEAKSKKSYAAKVKTSGGTAQVSRECKVL
jgi:hypothetical protein